jgi:hypothetical protein
LTGQADLQRYLAVRAQTERLADPLSAEDCALQSMPDASPTKWHLGHTSWFFETFVLERALPDFSSYRTEFRVLFKLLLCAPAGVSKGRRFGRRTAMP